MDQLIGSFLLFMEVEKGASGNTVSAYRNDLGQFDAFLPTTIRDPRDWGDISSEKIKEFISSVAKQGRAEATIARKVATIKSFYGYLQAEGLIRHNPAWSVESPSVERVLPQTLTISEVDQLLEQPLKRTTPEARRDRAILELLYATGVRVSELVTFNINDVHLPATVAESSGSTESADRPYVSCLGKGARERLIPIHDKAAVALVTYLKDGRGALVKSRPENALFVNHLGERMTRQGFRVILKKYAKEASLDTPVTPHTLRHSFAIHMLLGGMNTSRLQELLGHGNIATTSLYSSVARQERGRKWAAARYSG